jgi:hypothetical protein
MTLELDDAIGPFTPADTDAVPTPRKCRHPRDRRTPIENGWSCLSCGHSVVRAAILRGKRARQRGLALQRKAAAFLGLSNLQGNGAADARTESMYGNAAFVAQMKSGGLFPSWMQRELDYLPRGAGRTPILVVIETPGPGRKTRMLVVMDATDWRDLHVGDWLHPGEEGYPYSEVLPEEVRGG